MQCCSIGFFIYMFNFVSVNSAFATCSAISCFHPFDVLQHNGKYKGVRLGSGQDIFSHHLVVNPSFTIPRHSVPSDPKGKVARAVCITSTSLKSDVSNFLVVYPPRCE